MDDTMTGKTTRTVTFWDRAAGITHGSAHAVKKPAGTVVYVVPAKGGKFRIRIPGTLTEQVVSLGTIEPE